MSKLQALSGRVDWDQRPYMITGPALERIIVANQNRDMIRRAKPSKANLSKGKLGQATFHLLGWVALVVVFAGITLGTAKLIADYQAKTKVSEVWTADKYGNFIPMKHKGDK